VEDTRTTSRVVVADEVPPVQSAPVQPAAESAKPDWKPDENVTPLATLRGGKKE
jgi:hypothetical protein